MLKKEETQFKMAELVKGRAIANPSTTFSVYSCTINHFLLEFLKYAEEGFLCGLNNEALGIRVVKMLPHGWRKLCTDGLLFDSH